MAWYIWIIIAAIVAFFALMVFALLSANSPLDTEDDEIQFEWIKSLNKQKERN